MRRAALAVPLALLALAAPGNGQDSAPVYQQQQKKAFRFAGDSLARYEWTQDVPTADGLVNEDRYFVQARPRVELTVGPIELGVGGAFNYSDVENDRPPEGLARPLLIRDNYRSRGGRLDLAWGKLTAGPVVAQGGRFIMPIPLTEMIWDKDLRPQGGALALKLAEGLFVLQGVYATGSHVYEDESVLYGGSAALQIASGEESSLQLVGSYLQFEDLEKLESPIRRQNTRVADLITGEYQVVDLVGRIRRGGQMPLQLVANYCWNRAIDESNKGLWLAAVLGELGSSRLRAEYVYAKIDRDATLAAFNTDDFFWGTGWEGHRADVGTSLRKNSSLHGIAQWQRFKDSADPVAREQWVTRYRVEWRTHF